MDKNLISFLICCTFLVSCNLINKKDMDKEQHVKIETTMGDVVIKLYNETPAHRDNFLKLVEENTYEGTLFHRVIKDFMVQAGDPSSKNAPKGKMLGTGDMDYTIPAEFVYPQYFHKKGALSAARQGDQVNPNKESSGCQFYIVTGTVFTEEGLLSLESQINESKINKAFEKLAKEHMKEIYMLRKSNDEEGLYDLQEKLIAEAEKEASTLPDFKFTVEQVSSYTTVGGTPHLDNEYTVFGEVVEGIEIVDKIQTVKTDRNDRPEEDIKIIRMSILN